MSKRPALRYHGGKWLLASWIIQHFPQHRIYTEVFGGAASVLIQKEKSYAEIYNDKDDDVVNLFRILRDEKSSNILRELLENTPFAREEYKLAYKEAIDPIEKARRLIVRSFMGFGSDAHNPAKISGFRANSNRSGTTPAHDWTTYPKNIDILSQRLRGVVIENRCALEILLQHDGKETLHYIDPPYVHSTRSNKSRKNNSEYRYELTDDQHIELLELTRSLKGMIVISGYPNKIYDYRLRDWMRVERKSFADGARERTEVLWINDAASTHAPQLDIFQSLEKTA